MSDKMRLSNDAFMVRVREYLTMEADARLMDGADGGNAWGQGLADDVFYGFDADSVVAIWHAIEDIALEEASGSLLATVQEFSWVEGHRERCEQLAQTLDHVEMIGAGAAPRRIPNLRFLADRKGGAKRYRAVLYAGKAVQVCFVAEQENEARDFERRKFAGFYTFDPGLTGRLRADLLDLVSGASENFREFARQRAIYDAEREIQEEMAAQREALAKAVRRLRLDGERYRPRQFVSDLEKGLNRLEQWKNKMPKLMEQVEGN